jgi:3-oxoacyl-(acyl-carrier-protein) synthase
MTTESRSCLAAASLALRACGWKDTASREIGLVGAGYEGCVRADQEYFRDYVASGRSLGRGNLFIYTLPTSTLGEVAIALTLTGPTLHIHDPARPVAVLVAQAEQLVEEGESDAMLAVWSDCAAAVCFAIDRGQPENSLVGFVWEQGPLEMAQSLASMVQRI